MIDLNDLFNSFTKAETFRRVDEIHPLDLYVGIDELYRWTLLLVCDDKPDHLVGSKMIETRIGERKDGCWTISLSLINNEYHDIFLLFCGDIIDSSRKITNKKNGTRFIIRRYREWKEMLANSNNELLSAEKVKGLIGEMYVLDTELSSNFGIEKAVISWLGPKAAHQDFVLNNTWYEVKTTSSGREEVKISSVEQLDCKNDGKLIIVFADKTSKSNANAVSLNALYEKILKEITDDNLKSEFCNMLLKFGYYPRPEYDESDYIFEIKSIEHYFVDQTFPCLRRKDIPSEVTQAEYILSLPSIKGFREDK